MSYDMHFYLLDKIRRVFFIKLLLEMNHRWLWKSNETKILVGFITVAPSESKRYLQSKKYYFVFGSFGLFDIKNILSKIMKVWLPRFDNCAQFLVIRMLRPWKVYSKNLRKLSFLLISDHWNLFLKVTRQNVIESPEIFIRLHAQELIIPRNTM